LVLLRSRVRLSPSTRETNGDARIRHDQALLVEPLLVGGAGELGHRAREDGPGWIEAFWVLEELPSFDAQAVAAPGAEELRCLEQVLLAGPGHFGDRVAEGCGIRFVDEVGERLDELSV
jgi:hypothetical protein